MAELTFSNRIAVFGLCCAVWTACTTTSGPTAVPEVRIDGELSRRDVESVVRNGYADVQACERMHHRKGTEAGHVVVRWRVSVEGRVSDARVLQSTLAESRLEECLVGAVSAWGFPAPRDGRVVTIEYPFRFLPGR